MSQQNCHGCQGIRALTPRRIHNRSGLPAIDFRVGSYAAFLETMLARISELKTPRLGSNNPDELIRPLSLLTSRDSDDPGIAFLDSWATIGEVLSFYNERIANESFLKTATERRSIQQLANLVGYKLRPGLSSSVYLAFTVDDTSDQVLIPSGTPAKSTPAPDSNAVSQTFETSEDFLARHYWNEIRPRQSRPQDLTQPGSLNRLFLQGTGLQLNVGDYLAVVPPAPLATEGATIRQIGQVREIVDDKRQITEIELMIKRGSAPEIIENTRQIIDEFDFQNELGLTENIARLAKDDLLEVLAAGNERSIGKLDSHLQNQLLKKMILGITEPSADESANQNDHTESVDLPARIDATLDSLGRLLKQFSLDNQTYQSATRKYKTAHRNAGTKIEKWQNRLNTIATNPTDPRLYSRFSEQLQKAYWSIDFDPDKSPAPDMLVADNLTQPISETGQLVFPNPQVVADDDDFKDFATISINTRTTGALVLNSDVPDTVLEEIDRSNTAAVKIAIENGLERIEVTNFQPGFSYVLIQVVAKTADDPPKEEIIATTVHTVSSTGSESSVNLLQPTKINAQLMRGTDNLYTIDSTFALSNNKNRKFLISAYLLGDDPSTLLRNSFYDSGEQTVEELEKTIKSSPLLEPSKNLSEVLLEVSEKVGDSVTTVAYATRTISIVSGNTAFQALSELGQQIGNMSSNGSVAFQKIGALKTQLTNAAETVATISMTTRPERLLSTLVNESIEGIHGQLRKDLNIDSADRDVRVALRNHWQTLGKVAKNISPSANLKPKWLNSLQAQLNQDLLGVNSEKTAAIADDYETRLTELLSDDLKTYEDRSNRIVPLAHSVESLLTDYRETLVENLDGFSESIVSASGLKPVDAIRTKIDAFNNYREESPDPGKTGFEEYRKNVRNRDANLENLANHLNEWLGQPDASRVENGNAVVAVREFLNNAGIGVESQTRQDNTRNTGELFGDLLSGDGFDAGLKGIKSSNFDALFQKNSGLWPQVKAQLSPEQKKLVYDRLRRYRIVDRQPFVFVFRSTAKLFGWNSSEITKSVTTKRERVPKTGEQAEIPEVLTTTSSSRVGNPAFSGDEDPGILHLDGEYKKSNAGSLVAVAKDSDDPKLFVVLSNSVAPRSEYGLSSTATKIRVKGARGETAWWDTSEGFPVLRNTNVWCDAEPIDLAEEPMDLIPVNFDPRESFQSPGSWLLQSEQDEIVLDGFYPEISSRAKIILEGTFIESNVPTVSGVLERNVFEVVNVSHEIGRPAGSSGDELPGTESEQQRTLVFGDRWHTRIRLNSRLDRMYYRGSTRFYANVVEATHGGTVHEVAGNGEGTKSFQKFAVKDGPISRVSAVHIHGSRDELEVRVNNVRWDEVDRIVDSGSNGTNFELTEELDESNSIRFGDGMVNGARLPTGDENVRSTYRVGLGDDGNVESDRIDQLPSPPFGVQSVRNPMGASGGANRDTAYQSRRRTALTVTSMEKLVSITDYRNFALFFGGIDKAVATVESTGLISLIVAGPSFEPLPGTSALIRNLESTIKQQSEPGLENQVHSHQAMLMFIFARIRIEDRYLWEEVASVIRDTLFDQFSYARAHFETDIYASEVISAIQSVPGVVFVDLDGFAGIEREDVNPESEPKKSDVEGETSPTTGESELDSQNKDTTSNELADRARSLHKIEVRNRMLCFLTREIPNTLQLEQIQ